MIRQLLSRKLQHQRSVSRFINVHLYLKGRTPGYAYIQMPGYIFISFALGKITRALIGGSIASNISTCCQTASASASASVLVFVKLFIRRANIFPAIYCYKFSKGQVFISPFEALVDPCTSDALDVGHWTFGRFRWLDAHASSPYISVFCQQSHGKLPKVATVLQCRKFR